MPFILFAKHDLFIYIYMYNIVFIYNHIYTDSATLGMCMCALIVAIGVVCC